VKSNEPVPFVPRDGTTLRAILMCRISGAEGQEESLEDQADEEKKDMSASSSVHLDRNLDPFFRQLVLGHSPSGVGGLGMTAVYTHMRPETIRRQVLAALSTWPQSLSVVAERLVGCTP
jgi:hypothetical protein